MSTEHGRAVEVLRRYLGGHREVLDVLDVLDLTSLGLLSLEEAGGSLLATAREGVATTGLVADLLSGAPGEWALRRSVGTVASS